MNPDATSAGTNSSAAFAPVPQAQRLHVLDIVRGFAVFGILLMNLEAFAGPVLSAGSGLDPDLRGVDRWADALVYFFVQGKFYSLFSLLFGMGFAVMSQRAEAFGRGFAVLYLRRSLALLGIGLAHALLVWSGDILVTYALVALLLLAFRQVDGRGLLVLGLLCYLGASALILGLGALDGLMQLNPESAAAWNKAMGEQDAQMQALVEGQRQAYGHGSYVEALAQRREDFFAGLGSLVVIGPMVFGLFLLGRWFVESRVIVEPQRFPVLYAWLRWGALLAGLLLMSASYRMQPTMSLARIDLHGAIALSLSLWANLLLCLAYLAWLVRGLQAPRCAAWLARLAPAGQMALSNYLMQSVACTLVFYGYGLGLFGQMPRAWQLPFALLLFAVQLALSRAWLVRFRFGPMEWMWRAITYWRWPPLRRQA